MPALVAADRSWAVLASEDGAWLSAMGTRFPTAFGESIPNNSRFYRTDLRAFYYWDSATKTWTLEVAGGGGGSLTLQEVDGAPAGVATSLQVDQGDGLVLTDLGGGAFRVDLAAVPEAALALNFATHDPTNDPSAGEKAALAGTSGVPGLGNEYVTDDDPRNTNARAPTAHATSHQDGGADEISVTGLSGLLADAQTPAAHAASHQHAGADPIATATPGANAIPKATAGGKLDGWISDAAAGAKGLIQLAGDLAGTAASPAVAPGAITNAKAADMAANTIKANATAALADPADMAVAASELVGRVDTGDLQGIALADVTEDATPAAGDKLLGWAAGGAIRTFDVGNLPTGGAGEANLGANVGTAGVGVFKDKTGVTLNFKKLNAGDGSISVTDDTGSDEVDLAIPTDGVTTAKIAAGQVTYAKIQDVSATDKVLGRSTAGAGDVEEIPCTAAGRALIDDVDASAQRTTLGLAIGSNVQAWDAQLDDIAALAVTDGNIIVGNGTGWVAESGPTARTSLGLGTANSPEFAAVNVGHASDTTLARASAGNVSVEGNLLYRAGGTDVPVADGGTGGSTAATARANLAAGLVLGTTTVAALSPPDALTMYCGAVTLTNTPNFQGVTIPRAGTIKRVDINFIVVGTLASGETSTCWIRLNDTTDTVISTAVVLTALSNRFSNAALNIAVVAGDTFEIKWTSPTWATNPTNVYVHALVYIE